MTNNQKLIGVAFPYRDKDREALQEAFPGKVLPRVRRGSQLRRCFKCNIPVLVGPRLDATGLGIVCPLCAHTLGMRGFW